MTTMTKKMTIAKLSILAAVVLCAVPEEGKAANTIPLPDTSQCTSIDPNIPCFVIINNGASEDAYALVGKVPSTSRGTGVTGHADGNGRGVAGYSLQYRGVEGTSVAGDGVAGIAHSSGNGVTGINDAQGISAGYGVSGTATGPWPMAGVYGANPYHGGTAISAFASDATSGYGIFGQAATVGVAGYGTYTGGVGVSGVAGGTSGHAIDAICNGSCATSGSGYAGYFHGNVYATGTIVSGSSDARLKKNIRPLEGSLAQLLALRGVTFEWKETQQNGEPPGTQRGFIAQDVEKVVPEWIGTDTRGFKTIAIPGRAFEAMVVESIRTLKADNDDLRAQIKSLRQDRSPLASSLFSRGLGPAFALGLLPVGFIAALRLRSRRKTG